MTINTNFDRHIDIDVDHEGERPPAHIVRHARGVLGDGAQERWFNVTGLGYAKNWVWVLGINKKNVLQIMREYNGQA